jgi:hypothetical protein
MEAKIARIQVAPAMFSSGTFNPVVCPRVRVSVPRVRVSVPSVHVSVGPV